MKTEQASTFQTLEIGVSSPTSVPIETVHVTISSENMFSEFAKAFVNEAYRINPLKAEQVELTVDELSEYIGYLVTQRILCVQQECTLFRKLKALYIPAWIQYNLSMIGEVTIREKGLRMIPTVEVESNLTYEEALAISEKIGSFINDMNIVRDAMPRSIEGNVDVMSTAMIADYVRAFSPVEHVSSTYVTAFMGMKLQEEMAMQVLYRIQYDDVAFIQSALTTQKGLF